MKIRPIILAFFLLLCFNLVTAIPNPASVYCEDMGYTLNLSNGTCIFQNGSSCPEWDFFRGDCGQAYVKEIPCREIGEPVLTSFEKCCEGYAYTPKNLVGQVTCQTLSNIIIDNFKYNPAYWLGTLAVLGVIVYLVCKYSRKHKRKR